MIELAVKLISLPAHKVAVPPAVGAAGAGLTVTATVPAGPAQPPIRAITEYVPDAVVVTEGIEGFCVVDVNEAGPVQL